MADMTVRTLQTIRNDSAFDLFWKKIAQDANKLGITEPSLPRRKRIPRRIDDNSEDSYAYPSTPKEHYRRIYYEALDLIITCIKNCFNQPGYQMYQNLEGLLLKAANGEMYNNEIEAILQFYEDDFNPQLLKTQLNLFTTNIPRDECRFCISDIISFVRNLQSQTELLSEVSKVLK